MPVYKWGSEILVNTTLAGDQDQAAVTALDDGGFLIAWHDAASASASLHFQRYDAAGHPVGQDISLLNTVPGDIFGPAIAQTDSGKIALAFDFVSPDPNIRGEIVNLDGTVSGGGTLSSAPYAETGIAIAATSGFGGLAVWLDQTAPQNATGLIYMSRLDADGAIGFQPQVVDTATASASRSYAPDIAANFSGLLAAVVWTENGANAEDIHARVYGAGGNDLGPEFTINQYTDGAQVAPKLAWIDNDRFVVTWTTFDGPLYRDGDGTSIHYAIYNRDGYALGPEGLANSTVAGNQQNSAVAGLHNGGFVIAWEDFSASGGDMSGSAIRLQAFDGVGDKLGREILVNTTTAGDQRDITLTTLSDDRIVVTWTDTSSGNADIRSQIVDPRDGIVSGTPGADTLYGSDALGDEISGYDGADTLFGLRGSDLLYGGAGNDILSGGGGDDTAYGGAGADDVRGGRGDDALFGEDGNDTLSGGAGADDLDGGKGTDTASYSGASSPVAVALDGSLAASGEAAGDTLTSIESLTGSNIDGPGDTLKGNAAANTLSGLAGADTLIGGGGNDVLIGGRGADTLTGGGGNDKFAYLSQQDGGDVISDFSSNASGNNDAFQFKGSAFGGLTPGVALSASQFQSSTSDVAVTADIRFFYETDTHILRFDADGSGGGAAIVIATLQATAAVALADIIII